MIRTDLAVEAREMRGEGIKGVKSKSFTEDGATISVTQIIDENGEKVLGKRRGTYITVEAEETSTLDGREKAAKLLSRELSRLIEGKKCEKVLVIGLGNHNITPDSVGVNTAEQIFVTRHLKEHLPDTFSEAKEVSAIAPGVLGLTGIETGETVKALVEKISPDLVIVVDALASRSLSRIGRTFQLTDTGISPGSGVGNSRKEISQETLGVPTIALGVPMVVDAATVAADVFDVVLNNMHENFAAKILASMEEGERYALISQAVGENMASMFVTPKDVDSIADRAAEILRRGINEALHGNKFDIFY